MNPRTTAIVVTIVALVACACPGLFGLFMGGMFALISFVPGADINMLGNTDPQSALTFGLGLLCVSGLAVLAGAGATFWAWRRTATPAATTGR
jgi:hypothetical protein